MVEYICIIHKKITKEKLVNSNPQINSCIRVKKSKY